MSRNHSLLNKTEPFCWTCGKKHTGQNDWLKCGGCESVQCPTCDENLVSFFISFCESCGKEYCNLCSEKDVCPDGGHLGYLVYAYGERYFGERKRFVLKDTGTNVSDLTDEMIRELMS